MRDPRHDGSSVVDVAAQRRAVCNKVLDGDQVIVPLVLLDLIQRRSIRRAHRPVAGEHDARQPKIEILEREMSRAIRTDRVEIIQARELEWRGEIWGGQWVEGIRAVQPSLLQGKKFGYERRRRQRIVPRVQSVTTECSRNN